MPAIWTIALDEQKTFDRLRAAVSRAVEFDEPENAREFVVFMEKFWKENPGFAAANPEFNAAYANLYRQAQWIALPHESARELPDLFRQHIKAAWELPGYDIAEKLRQFLVTIPPEHRDELKKQILQALEASTVALTPGKMTVGSWLKDYFLFVGPPPTNTLKQSQYFSTNKNFTALQTQDQEKMRQILRAAERLRQSSLTPEGYEEGEVALEIKGKVVALAGRALEEPPDDVVDAMKSLFRAPSPEEARARMRRAYEGDAAAKERYRAAEADLQKTTGGDPEKLREELHKLLAALPGAHVSPERAAAVVFALIRAGIFEDTLRRDAALKNAFAEYFKKTSHPEDFDAIKLTPVSPLTASAFLQLLLRERAGLSAAESARLGMQAANELKKKGLDNYLEMAYFDPAGEAFAWSKVL